MKNKYSARGLLKVIEDTKEKEKVKEFVEALDTEIGIAEIEKGTVLIVKGHKQHEYIIALLGGGDVIVRLYKGKLDTIWFDEQLIKTEDTIGKFDAKKLVSQIKKLTVAQEIVRVRKKSMADKEAKEVFGEEQTDNSELSKQLEEAKAKNTTLKEELKTLQEVK